MDGLNKTLNEIADLVKGEVIGDPQTVVTGLNGLKESRSGDLSFLANPKYISAARTSSATAIIVDRSIDLPGKTLIRTDNPSMAFAQVADLCFPVATPKFKGVHPTAYVAEDAQIGERVTIGPNAVVETGAHIGDETIIFAGSYIGHHVTIGKGSVIYPNVTIREFCKLGDRVILHPGVVVGSDGFGYEQIHGKNVKIRQIGTVEIGNDVEIGANTTIDRARFDVTRIGSGTKIDNLVQIGHNVIIGEDCIIVALVGIAGSSTLGDKVIIGGQAGVLGHLTIGEGSLISSQAGVTKSIPPYTHATGFPAQKHREFHRLQAHLRRLPKYVKTLSEIKEYLSSVQLKENNDV